MNSAERSDSNVIPLLKRYRINEWFYSLQGEGVRSGTANLFLRFSGCNLKCNALEHGFNCDTEFTSGEWWTSDQILGHLKDAAPDCRWVILTGGEPMLQVDTALIESLHSAGYKIAIETNGTRAVPASIDWICVSPKTAEHTILQKTAQEVKYVRAYGMGIPQPSVVADHYLISPAFESDQLPPKNLEWCIELVRKNPQWRLSLQSHKLIRVR